MIKVQKLNNIRVKKIDVSDVLPKKDNGFKSEIILQPYPNIACIGKKGYGKTNLILNLVNHLLKTVKRKNVVVFIFCSTLNLDVNYKKLMKTLDDKNIPYFAYTSIHQEDALRQLISSLETEDDVQQQLQKKEKPPNAIRTGGVGRERQPPKLRYLCIFDDLGGELRTPEFGRFLIRNRHLRCCNIISSQYIHHLTPESTFQIDLYLLFKDLPIEKLKLIHERADLNIDFERFLNLYRTSTHSDRYNFFYVDTRTPSYRINFDIGIE